MAVYKIILGPGIQVTDVKVGDTLTLQQGAGVAYNSANAFNALLLRADPSGAIGYRVAKANVIGLIRGSSDLSRDQQDELIQRVSAARMGDVIVFERGPQPPGAASVLLPGNAPAFTDGQPGAPQQILAVYVDP